MGGEYLTSYIQSVKNGNFYSKNDGNLSNSSFQSTQSTSSFMSTSSSFSSRSFQYAQRAIGRMPNLNCLTNLSKESEGNSNWSKHLKFVCKHKFQNCQWADFILKNFKKSSSKIDKNNLKEIQKNASNCFQMSEINLKKIISEISGEEKISDQQDKIIQQILDNTEILKECLQELRIDQDGNQYDLIKKNEEIYRNIFFYKSITDFIKSNIDAQNPLKKLQTSFYEYLFRRYEGLTIFSEKGKEIFKQLIEDLKQFIQFYLEIIRIYYKLDEIILTYQQQYFLSVENLSNFVCGLLFKNEQIYKLLYNIHSQQEQDFQNKYKSYIDAQTYKKPEDFGIPEQFCLNEKTLKKYQKKLQKNFESPYQKAILQMGKLKYLKTNIEKIKAMIRTSEIIEECIQDFQSSHEIVLDKNYDAESLLAIFSYIIVKSQNYDLFTHLNLINSYTSKSNMSISGYLLITLEGCVFTLANQSDEKINQMIRDQEDSKKSFELFELTEIQEKKEKKKNNTEEGLYEALL